MYILLISSPVTSILQTLIWNRVPTPKDRHMLLLSGLPSILILTILCYRHRYGSFIGRSYQTVIFNSVILPHPYISFQINMPVYPPPAHFVVLHGRILNLSFCLSYLFLMCSANIKWLTVQRSHFTIFSDMYAIYLTKSFILWTQMLHNPKTII